jgi:hypothetical protein
MVLSRIFKVGFFLTVVIACNSNQDFKKEAWAIQKSDDFKTINVFDQYTPGINISMFGNEIEYIPLETSENSLIGNIDKLLYTDNKLFVLDLKVAHTLFVFDFSGKLIYKKKVGLGGPGEFKSIKDFAIDSQSNRLYIYSDSERKIFQYILEDGAFVSTFRLNNAVFDNLYVDSKNRFLLTRDGRPSYKTSGYGEFRICQIDSTGKLENGWLDYPGFQFTSFDKSSTTLTGSESKDLIIRRPLKDTVYVFKNDSVQALCKINFGETSQKIQNEIFLSKDENSLTSMLFNPELAYLMGDFFNTSKYLSFSFAKKGEGAIFLLDKTNNRQFVSKNIQNDIDNIPIRNIQCWDDRFLMCIIDPGSIKRQYDYFSREAPVTQYHKLAALNDKIGKDANPVIGMIRF